MNLLGDKIQLNKKNFLSEIFKINWAVSYNSDLYVTEEIQGELKLPLHSKEAEGKGENWKGKSRLGDELGLDYL